MTGKNLTPRNKGKYSYNTAGLSETKCLLCNQPIGGEDYTECHIMARFGQMFFLHARCDENLKKDGDN